MTFKNEMNFNKGDLLTQFQRKTNNNKTKIISDCKYRNSKCSINAFTNKLYSLFTDNGKQNIIYSKYSIVTLFYKFYAILFFK